MSNRNVTNALDLVDSFLKQARAETKSGLSKEAYDPSEPTSHPVMKADDGTRPATEGSRSAENAADVKKVLGEAGVTGQEDAAKGAKPDPTDGIGTTKMDSSEVKGNVVKPKSDKDKPDESPSHPSNSTFSEKYSSALGLGNKIIEAFSNLQVKTAEDKPSPETSGVVVEPTEVQIKEAAANDHREDAEAGYMAAEILTEQLGLQKQANDEVEANIDAMANQIVKAAEADANLYADYLFGTIHGKAVAKNTKKADHEMMPGAEDAGASGGSASEIPPEVAAALGGGGAGLGGPEGQDQGGPQDEEAIIEALAQALDEAGVTPEELAQALSQAEANGGEGGQGGLEAPVAEAPVMEAPAEKMGSLKANVKQASDALKAATKTARQSKIASALTQLAK